MAYFVEAPDFELQNIYRALSVLSDDADLVQSSLYKNSLKYSKRNTDVIYYDCTNIEEGDVSDIVAINKHRWRIEECFRIMKHEFKARSANAL